MGNGPVVSPSQLVDQDSRFPLPDARTGPGVSP